jgi:hypothetical protein
LHFCKLQVLRAATLQLAKSTYVLVINRLLVDFSPEGGLRTGNFSKHLPTGKPLKIVARLSGTRFEVYVNNNRSVWDTNIFASRGGVTIWLGDKALHVLRLCS